MLRRVKAQFAIDFLRLLHKKNSVLLFSEPSPMLHASSVLATPNIPQIFPEAPSQNASKRRRVLAQQFEWRKIKQATIQKSLRAGNEEIPDPGEGTGDGARPRESFLERSPGPVAAKNRKIVYKRL